MNTALATPPTNTPPTSSTATSNTVTEAVIICSALAWKGNPLSGLDIDANYATRVVGNTRATESTNHILSWRTHTDPDSWDLRWAWARRITLHHFNTTPGLNNLPLHHTDAPRAATPTL